MKQIVYLIVLCLIIGSCTSSKKYYQRAQYDMAIKKAVTKLRKKPNKEKEMLTLEQAYGRAMDKDNERINFLKLEGNPDMWDEVYSRYNKMKSRQSLVKDVLPLEVPSTGRMIQFKMVNFDEEIINAKKKAAEYYYANGKTILNKENRTREDAKKAYLQFKRVKQLYSNYKDIDNLMKESKFLATLKVIAEPIPMHSATFQLTNEFFDNKINEFLATMPASEFVKFYTQQEAEKIGLQNPDHIIQLIFDDFVVGQTHVKEQIQDINKDNVFEGILVGTQIKKGTDKVDVCHKVISTGSSGTKTISIEVQNWETHKKHGDYLGDCVAAGGTPTTTMKEMFGTVKAKLFITTKTLLSNGVLDFKIKDAETGKVISQEKLPGEFGWQCQWGYFNGDIRALSSKQIESTKGKELPPPPPQTLFMEFTKPIYNQLTNKIKTFYANY